MLPVSNTCSTYKHNGEVGCPANSKLINGAATRKCAGDPCEASDLDTCCTADTGYFNNMEIPCGSSVSAKQYATIPCVLVENVASDATLTCSTCLNSRVTSGKVSSCLDAHTFDTSGTADVCRKLDCTAGKYAGNAPAAKCEPCQSGRTSEKSTVGKCSACKVGQFVETITEACVICPSGFAAGAEESKSCLRCEVGETSPKGSTKCTSCDLGRYGKRNGDAEHLCEDCKPGMYNDQKKQTSCLSCPVDTYNSESGKPSKADCTKCRYPGGTSVGNIAPNKGCAAAPSPAKMSNAIMTSVSVGSVWFGLVMGLALMLLQ